MFFFFSRERSIDIICNYHLLLNVKNKHIKSSEKYSHLVVFFSDLNKSVYKLCKENNLNERVKVISTFTDLFSGANTCQNVDFPEVISTMYYLT